MSHAYVMKKAATETTCESDQMHLWEKIPK